MPDIFTQEGEKYELVERAQQTVIQILDQTVRDTKNYPFEKHFIIFLIPSV